MPIKAKELSALSVSRLKENGRHAVGGVDGLHLRIFNNSKSWVLRVSVGQRIDDHGKIKTHRRDIGLGPYPEVSLAEAREKARELKQQIRNGIDPIKQKLEDFKKNKNDFKITLKTGKTLGISDDVYKRALTACAETLSEISDLKHPRQAGNRRI